MKYYTIPPPKNLAHYVRFFWVLEGEASATDPFIHRCMADGCPELLFHYKGRFDKLSPANTAEDCFSSGIQAQSHSYRRFLADDNFGMFGVYLYPYAIPQLFSIPSSALTNHMPELHALLGKDAEILEEQMILATTNAERVTIISALLQSRLPHIKKPQAGIAETIAHIIHAKGACNVETIARQNFLSVRQFERHFKNLSGFSPKLFLRITRFQSTLAQYRDRQQSLTAIAHDCGYHDQSHFIRDFKEFSGYNPRQYFLGQAEEVAYIGV